MNTLKQILSSPWFGGFSFITSLVLATILSIWGVRRSTRIASPRYWIKQTTVLSKLEAYPGLEIAYCGQAVKEFTLARVAFWNGGSAPIKRADIATKSPIRIQLGVGDARVLGSVVDAYCAVANDLKLEADPHGLTIDFEFLDPQDGCIVRLFHDGPVTQPIEVVGKIPGLRFVDDGEHASRFIARGVAYWGWFGRMFEVFPKKVPVLGDIGALLITLAASPLLMVVMVWALVAQGVANALDAQRKRFRA